MNLPTLYKKDAKGKIRCWSIITGTETVNGDTVEYYSVSHGQDGGALQTTKVIVESGKNIGRSNETTAKQQCEAEAAALFEKQKSRKGYTEGVPTECPNLPMLAHKYADYSHKIEWPAIASYKIDGIRLIADVKNTVKCTSRTGKEIKYISHITDELAKNCPDLTIDGELYSHTIDFEEITSIVRKSKNEDPRMHEIYFYVFDLINDQSYHERLIKLDSLVVGLKHVKIVPWKIVKNEEELIAFHKKAVSEGFEGTMVRNIASLYQPNKRSTDLLKFKDFIDEEFEIVGWKVGKGKFANVPTFQFKMKSGDLFEAVPKGNEAMRAEYLKDAKKLIGQMATVRFFEYTSKGIPRFPVMIALRNYE